MAETKTAKRKTETTSTYDRAGNFWDRNKKAITIAAAVIVLLAGAYLAYKYLVQEPNERKAAEAMFKAEEYYRMDSLEKALNGDGLNAGFLKIIDKYGGTDAGNLARFYAGSILLQQGQFSRAVNQLTDFETDAKQIQARAYKLTGDAYAEQGKNKDALEYYKKAARHFPKDEVSSSDYLFTAAYFAARIMNDKEEAIDLLKELKKKYARTEKGFEVDKYLAQLGVYETEK
jgi:predicted negative regulator of RcsB-dependent stress response